MASLFSFIRNPELAGNLAGDIVKSEVGTLVLKAKRYFPGVAFIAAGLLIATGGLVLLVLGLLEVLTFVMPFWLAAGLIGASLVLIAAGLVYQGRASLSEAALEQDSESSSATAVDAKQ